jgi:hypothetical protein
VVALPLGHALRDGDDVAIGHSAVTRGLVVPSIYMLAKLTGAACLRALQRDHA